ncbi:hypothetical protein E2C01_000478 [Portunus trituberculatus]|uniref:Uncharacterized protein n=1 Tax=Portunus trituberculatus TaxID=210409 RepID=A0A5B7CEF6_PORTR|nr:hypothetical protein [Portunus trituberculatus]
MVRSGLEVTVPPAEETVSILPGFASLLSHPVNWFLSPRSPMSSLAPRVNQRIPFPRSVASLFIQITLFYPHPTAPQGRVARGRSLALIHSQTTGYIRGHISIQGCEGRRGVCPADLVY